MCKIDLVIGFQNSLSVATEGETINICADINPQGLGLPIDPSFDIDLHFLINPGIHN